MRSTRRVLTAEQGQKWRGHLLGARRTHTLLSRHPLSLEDLASLDPTCVPDGTTWVAHFHLELNTSKTQLLPLTENQFLFLPSLLLLKDKSFAQSRASFLSLSPHKYCDSILFSRCPVSTSSVDPSSTPPTSM